MCNHSYICKKNFMIFASTLRLFDHVINLSKMNVSDDRDSQKNQTLQPRYFYTMPDEKWYS